MGIEDDGARSAGSDRADSTAGETPTCWTCGWDTSAGESHDGYILNEELEPHPYEEGDRDQGITEICSAAAYDLDGYFVPVEPGFGGECVLLSRCIRWEEDQEGYLDELGRGSYQELAQD